LTLKRVFHHRNNSGALISEHKGKKRFFRFGASESPDIVCVVQGVYVGIEVKGPHGTQSEGRQEFQRKLEQSGGTYILAFSLEDVIQLSHENPWLPHKDQGQAKTKRLRG
jgi:hypothetical protein